MLSSISLLVIGQVDQAAVGSKEVQTHRFIDLLNKIQGDIMKKLLLLSNLALFAILSLGQPALAMMESEQLEQLYKLQPRFGLGLSYGEQDLAPNKNAPSECRTTRCKLVPDEKGTYIILKRPTRYSPYSSARLEFKNSIGTVIGDKDSIVIKKQPK